MSRSLVRNGALALLLVVGVLVLGPTIAFAQDAAIVAADAGTESAKAALDVSSAMVEETVAASVPDTGLEKATTTLLDIVLPVAVMFTTGLAGWLMTKIAQLLGLKVKDEHAIQWSNLARRGALRAAEWARNKAKEATDGKKVPGNEVLDVALGFVTGMAEQFKLPGMARTQLEGMIEAELFQLRREEKSGKDV